jgi:hypothetical protein
MGTSQPTYRGTVPLTILNMSKIEMIHEITETQCSRAGFLCCSGLRSDSGKYEWRGSGSGSFFAFLKK